MVPDSSNSPDFILGGNVAPRSYKGCNLPHCSVAFTFSDGSPLSANGLPRPPAPCPPTKDDATVSQAQVSDAPLLSRGASNFLIRRPAHPAASNFTQRSAERVATSSCGSNASYRVWFRRSPKPGRAGFLRSCAQPGRRTHQEKPTRLSILPRRQYTYRLRAK